MIYGSQRVVIAGHTASPDTCLAWAVDKNIVTGTVVAYEFGTKVFTVNGTTAPVVADSFTPPSANFTDVNSQGAGANAGTIS